MTKAIFFGVEGVPVPQGSSRAFQRGGRIVVVSDNPNLKAWREVVSAYAALATRGTLPEPFAGPVSVKLTFRLPYPKGAPKRSRQSPIRKPDLDKLVRAVLDSLSGIVFVDDNQVIRIVANKTYAADNEPPGVTILVAAY